jgi:HlyD family secretion protein
VKRTIIETVNASGKVYPEIEVKISPDISGEITELTVQEGDSVRKGQMLARIYADIYASQRDEASSRVAQSEAGVANSNAALEALKATLDQAKSTYDRQKQLLNDKVISKAEFEQNESALRSAQANYNAALQNIRSLRAGVQSAETGLVQANKNLGRATIVAPMDGVISLLAVKKGERVVGTAQMAGTEMMRVADLKIMEVRVDVGENDVVKVSIGDSADVEVDAYNNRKFKGLVTQIAASTKSGSQQLSTNDVTNYEVRIRLDTDSYKDLLDPSKPKKFPFRPGMNASADIKTHRKDNVLSVPINAVAARVKGSDKSIEEKKKEEKKIKKDDQTTDEETKTVNTDELEEVVFIRQQEGKVKKVIVTTGIQDITYIEIRSGLKEGDEIVTGPYNAISKTLKDGAKVKVVPKDKLF